MHRFHLSSLRSGVLEWRPMSGEQRVLSGAGDCLSILTLAANLLSGSHCRKGRQSNCRQIDKQTVRWVPRQTDRQIADMRSLPPPWRYTESLSSWMASSFKVTAFVSPSPLNYLSVMQTHCGLRHCRGRKEGIVFFVLFFQWVLHCLKKRLQMKASAL